MPLISAIFVFHRHTPYLRPALQSLLAQTQPDFEVIVVDNGTGLGLGAFGDDGRDPRLRLLSFPQNRGIAAAHNAAVALAQSEFIALMDYDDVALPRRFACQVAAMQAKPQLGLVFGHQSHDVRASRGVRAGTPTRGVFSRLGF
jgi:GT2 family glycosyltransferase